MKEIVVVIVVVALVAGAVAVAYVKARTSPEDLIETASKSVERGDWQAAIEAASEAIAVMRARLKPDATPSDELLNAHLLLSRAFSRAEKHDEAIDSAEALLALTESRYGKTSAAYGHTLRETADILLAAGKKREARSRFQSALEIVPEEAGALAGLAVLARQSGEVSAAIAYWDRALSRLESEESVETIDPYALLTDLEVLAEQSPSSATRGLLERARALGKPFGGDCLMGTAEGVVLDLPGWEVHETGYGYCTTAYTHRDFPQWLVRVSAIRRSDLGDTPPSAILLAEERGNAASGSVVQELGPDRALRRYWISDLVGERHNRVYFWRLWEKLRFGEHRNAHVSLSVLEEAQGAPETNELVASISSQVETLRLGRGIRETMEWLSAREPTRELGVEDRSQLASEIAATTRALGRKVTDALEQVGTKPGPGPTLLFVSQLYACWLGAGQLGASGPPAPVEAKLLEAAAEAFLGREQVSAEAAEALLRAYEEMRDGQRHLVQQWVAEYQSESPAEERSLKLFPIEIEVLRRLGVDTSLGRGATTDAEREPWIQAASAVREAFDGSAAGVENTLSGS
jgi:tetratricopeptide (TPR) repeat protein